MGNINNISAVCSGCKAGLEIYLTKLLETYDINIVKIFLWENQNNVNMELCKMKCNKSTQKGVDFLLKKKHYFILRSLVIKYGKDNVINTVNNIVINNEKEDE